MKLRIPGKFICFLIALICCCGGPMPRDVRQVYRVSRDVDFNFDIRPILADKCFPCHGPDEKTREAKLRLDEEHSAFLNQPESSGPAFVRSKPLESQAILRILSDDPTYTMPPPDSKLSLGAEEKALLYRWVQEGAVWKPHWSFITPALPEIPKVKERSWPRNAIDFFVLSKMETHRLRPNGEANRETLIRRLTMDLTGLPPTLQEIDGFISDQSEQAYEKLVDRLLASPHFGERWCWDWQDVARYADTNGFQGDPERKMWPWRDWVIRAFNENKPFDIFSIEQLAGDLLPEASKDQILATAFNRNHMYNGEGGRIPEETRVENVFDRVETFGTTWMGLTLNCTRCHDHKFDPLSQKEYYQLFDFFNQTSEEGLGYNGRIQPVLDLSDTISQAEVKKVEVLIQKQGEEVYQFELGKFPRESGKSAADSPAAQGLDGDQIFALGFDPLKRNPYHLGLISNHFKDRDPGYFKELQDFRKLIRVKDSLTAGNLQVMVMDHLEKPRISYILDRGIYDKKLEEVKSSVPAILPGLPEGAKVDRLALARWLFSEKHPLTARVTVNRYWQAIFGTGLVKTPEDFGVQGSKPTHPELLDWLAVEFQKSGWDFKKLIKMMVMSATYRQSSQATKQAVLDDPENKWLSRASRYRWPSWMLRDQVLSVSGLMNDSIGGPPVKPYQPAGIWEEATFGFKKYVQDHGEALYRRTLYIFWRRIVGPTNLFDNAARQICEVKPVRTNTPLHALVTMNDPTYVESARNMAQSLLNLEIADDERIKRGFRLVTSRHPEVTELEILVSRFQDLQTHYQNHLDEGKGLVHTGESPCDENLDLVDLAAYTALCSVLLNLDEVLSRQ